MSLRHRLVAALVLIGATLVVAGVVVAGLIRGALIDQVDRQLERTTPPLGVFIGAFEPGAPIGVRPGTNTDDRFTEVYVAVARPRACVCSARPWAPSHLRTSATCCLPTASLVDPSPRFVTVGAVGGGPQYRVLIEGVPNGGAIAFAQSLRATEHTYRQIVTVEVIAFLTVLLTLCMMAWWLLHHGVRPIEKMAMTANAIADGDLSRRVAPAEDKTEVGRLGIALNTMLGQIEGAFDERRESENRLRRFVADASHELRTPLTSIRGYAELWRAGAISSRTRAGRRNAAGRARGGADGPPRRRHALARAARRRSSARS